MDSEQSSGTIRLLNNFYDGSDIQIALLGPRHTVVLAP